MPRPADDSPYSDDATPTARPSGGRGRRPASGRHQGGARKTVPRPPSRSAKPAPPPRPAPASARKATGAGPERASKRRKKTPRGQPPMELTSHPTSRNAMVNTRAWLLEEYGPHCAYCGGRFAARVMTLDHVAPRRGQTAYDRRDNLVLCCRDCNAAKRDMAPLAFLLGVRTRAANLVRYGAHLSAGLLDLARPLVRSETEPLSPRKRYGPAEDDEESPYRD